MTTGEAQNTPGSGGAWDWARFQEHHFHPLYNAVYDRLAIGSGMRLLDAGCGPGGAALLAESRGARVAGIDASPVMIDVARERLPAGDFRVGDMEMLPWSDGSFDAVTGFNAFQFARNAVVALAEARRVLVQGGKVGMVTWMPPAASEQPKVMAVISALAPSPPPGAPGPFALSGPGLAESVLAAAGFRLVDMGEAPIVVEYPDAEAACRAMMAGSGGVRAIQHSGEDRVRQAVLEALDEFHIDSGGYRFRNVFRFIIAE